MEPGRIAIAPAGTTLYRVGAVKTIPGVRRYVVTDGGLYENVRAALYGANYEAAAANKMTAPRTGPSPPGWWGRTASRGM